MEIQRAVKAIENFFTNPMTGEKEVEVTFKEVDAHLTAASADAAERVPLQGRISKIPQKQEEAIQAVASEVLARHEQGRIPFGSAHLAALHGFTAQSKHMRAQAVEKSVWDHVKQSALVHIEQMASALSKPAAGGVDHFLHTHTVGEKAFILAGEPREALEICQWLAQMAYRAGPEGYTLVEAKPTVKQLSSSSDIPLTVTMQNNLTGLQEAFQVTIEADSPHRLTSIEDDPAVLPPDFSSKKVDDAAIKKQMQELLDKLKKAEAFSGAVLHAHKGAIVFEHAIGKADRQKKVDNTLDTSFNLASVGKLVTAELIARLVADHKLEYGQTIDTLLPETVKEKFKHVSFDEWKQITVKDLLAHTSGFSGNYHDNPGFVERFGGKDAPLAELLSFAGEKQKRGVSSYCNTNYLLLGAIIEKTAGKEYRAYAQGEIFAKMPGSGGFLNYTKGNPDLAVGYEPTVKKNSDNLVFTPNTDVHVAIGGPDGGSAATVRGMLEFGRQYLGRVESAQEQEQSPGYAMEKEEGVLTVGHLGAFEGAASLVNIYPASGDILIILSNEAVGRPIDTQTIERTFFGLLKQRLASE